MTQPHYSLSAVGPDLLYNKRQHDYKITNMKWHVQINTAKQIQ